MDESQDWARRILGSHGPTLRELIPQVVKEVHAASVESQKSSQQKATRAYGLFSSGVLERFECFGKLAGATLISPGGANYWVPVVNRIAIFPWRFARNPGKRMEDTPFSTSVARTELPELHRQPMQGTLDFDLTTQPSASISNDSELTDRVEGITNHPDAASHGLVLVAINSSVEELHSVEWGLAVSTVDRRLEWRDFHEVLLTAHHPGPVSTSPNRTFTSGEIPRRLSRDGDDAVDTQGDR
ncbi:hypothetical protein [Nocardia carnea]|uniref:hypothetical protein n=1 Tax=Nocardia carnea TaxID=37328 RepID=UPI0024565011|nr:hypothetical protein [Nocardia carnea]